MPPMMDWNPSEKAGDAIKCTVLPSPEGDAMRKKYLINGRMVNIDSIDLDLPGFDEDPQAYYEVWSSAARSILIFSGYRGAHFRVLEHALGKWYDMGEVPEVFANFPTDQIVET